jgi:FixJ family two-component response regulator
LKVAEEPVIAVIDDDASVREAVGNLLRSDGWQARCFASAEAFLQSPSLAKAACLVLDLGLPGMNGLQLQQQLRHLGSGVPIIFLTAVDDGAARSKALQHGAVAFLLKPFQAHELLGAVRRAVRG